MQKRAKGAQGMDAKTCIEKLREARSVAMATVDADGAPQVRIIDVMHVEPARGEIYFVTARGKAFYRELQGGRGLAMTVLTPAWEMIRVAGMSRRVPDALQKEWVDRIFEENPSMDGVYPGQARYILETFCVDRAEVEYFDLGKHPVFRETYTIGQWARREKGYRITDACVQCGRCAGCCPQGCIEPGTPYRIIPAHCLHCGYCAEQCPAGAVEPLG